jgi:hypothetical protein
MKCFILVDDKQRIAGFSIGKEESAQHRAEETGLQYYPAPDGLVIGQHTHYSPERGELYFLPDEVLSKRLAEIRTARDEMLNRCDAVHCNAERWSAMTPEKQQTWREYKQALRDFPTTCDPSNPIWPTPPI